MKKIGCPQSLGVFLVNLTNVITIFPSIPQLSRFGRKPIMITWTIVMLFALFMMTFFSQWFHFGHAADYLELVCVLIFVAAFEMSWGPITWLYLAEICNDKSMSIAMLANWTCGLLIGQLTPYLLNEWLQNYTFLLFFAFTVGGLIFVIVYMKETKGLTETEIKVLYWPKNKSLGERVEELEARLAAVENKNKGGETARMLNLNNTSFGASNDLGSMAQSTGTLDLNGLK